MRVGRPKPLAIFLTALPLLAIALYVFAGARYAHNCSEPQRNCAAHRDLGCTISGVYPILIGANFFVDAECDMETDNGGWTLVANYLHRGNKRSAAVLRTIGHGMPYMSGRTLGGDDLGSSETWGHLRPDLLNAIPFREIRFQCESSSHNRKVDFAIFSSRCLDYFRKGVGACAGTPELNSAFMSGARPLPGHTGFLPTAGMSGWKDQGEFALTNYPFYFEGRAAWSIGAQQNRWECDDIDPGGVNNTWHRIWIR
jgi:hypothetical protein